MVQLVENYIKLEVGTLNVWNHIKTMLNHYDNLKLSLNHSSSKCYSSMDIHNEELGSSFNDWVDSFGSFIGNGKCRESSKK